jgi:hypothetical protein
MDMLEEWGRCFRSVKRITQHRYVFSDRLNTSFLMGGTRSEKEMRNVSVR